MQSTLQRLGDSAMTDAQAIVQQALVGHRAAIDGFFAQYEAQMIAYADRLAACFDAGNKVMICGNGGSTCDALHFAGECVGRFVNDRRPLPAIALNADPGILTAIGNDYGFEEIFARQLRAHAKTGDVLIAISTSGQSKNILRVLEEAQALGIHSLLLTGERGKTCKAADEVWAVPSTITAHIQETHITALQLMIALIENKLF